MQINAIGEKCEIGQICRRKREFVRVLFFYTSSSFSFLAHQNNAANIFVNGLKTAFTKGLVARPLSYASSS